MHGQGCAGQGIVRHTNEGEKESTGATKCYSALSAILQARCDYTEEEKEEEEGRRRDRQDMGEGARGVCSTNQPTNQ